MKKLFFLIAVISCYFGYGQIPSIGYFRYDTVKIQKVGGSAELVLLNKTRDTMGFLMNGGGGKTKFVRMRQLDSNTLIIPGIDTFHFAKSGGGGSDSALSQTRFIGIPKVGSTRFPTLDTGALSTYYLINHPGTIQVDNTSILRVGGVRGDSLYTIPIPGGSGGPQVWVDNIDSVKAYRPANGAIYYAKEYHTGTGISNAPYQYNSSSTATGNDINVLMPTVGSDAGRWILTPLNNEVSLNQVGVFPNSSNTAAVIQTLYDAGYKTITAGPGRFYFTDSVHFANANGLTIHGAGSALTEFYSVNKKTIFFIEAAQDNNEISGIHFNSRVSDATNTPAAGLIYFYSETNGLQAKNNYIHDNLFTCPFTKSNAFFRVTQGTGAMETNMRVEHNTFDSIGRMAFEYINHQDATNDRFSGIHCDYNTFRNVGYVNTGLAVLAISFSGPGNKSTANYNEIIDTREGVDAVYGGIENAQSTDFQSIGNHIYSPAGYGSIAFLASGGGSNKSIINWTIDRNVIDLHSTTHPEYCYGILAGRLDNSKITNNTSSTDNYFFKSDHRNLNNEFYGNIAQRISSSSPNVLYLADSTQFTMSHNNRYTALGGSGGDAVVQTDGVQTKYNTFNDTLVADGGGRGIVYQVNSSTDNVRITTPKQYAGTPEGNVTGSPGDIAVNTSNGDLYTKGTGTGNTGWVALGSSVINLSKTQSANQLIINPSGGGTPTPLDSVSKTIMGPMTPTQYSALISQPKVYNVVLYGADSTGVANSGPGIKAAIAAWNAEGRKGYVSIPEGVYSITDPIDSTSYGYDCNCQIPIPIDSITGNRARLVIRGETPPNTTINGATAAARVQPKGVIIYSKYTGDRSSRIAGTAVFGSNGPNLGGVGNGENLNYLTLENINIVVKNNPNGAGPEIGGANGRHIAGSRFINCTYSVDTAGDKTVMPLRPISGFETSDCDNEIGNEITHTLVIGPRYGYIVGEHTTGTDINAFLCYNAIGTKWGNHGAQLGRVLSQWVANTITYVDQGSGCQVTPLSSIKIDFLDIEDAGACYTGKWFNTIYSVNDSLNRIHADITYWISECGVGGDGTATWSMNGGSHVQAHANGVAISGGGGGISGLTAGYTPVATSSTAIANGGWYYDGTNVRYGFGTTTPQRKIDVVASGSVFNAFGIKGSSSTESSGFEAINDALNVSGIRIRGSAMGDYNGFGPGSTAWYSGVTTHILIDSAAGFDIINGPAGAGTKKFTMYPNGVMNFGVYGTGAITGTPASFPAFNSTGDIIEADGALVTTGTQSFNGTKTFGNSASTNSTFNLNATTGYNTNLVLQKGGLNQWYIQNNATADDLVIFGSDANLNPPAFRLTQAGDMLTPASSYHNFGTTSGSSGYGIRDNAGTIEIKNSGGSWAAPGGGGSGTDTADIAGPGITITRGSSPAKRTFSLDFTQVSGIVYSTSDVGLTSNTSHTYTTPNDGVAHIYRVNFAVTVTTGSGGTSHIQSYIAYTDPNSNSVGNTAVPDFTGGSSGLNATAAATSILLPLTFTAKPNTTITLSSALTGANGVTWNNRVALELVY